MASMVFILCSTSIKVRWCRYAADPHLSSFVFFVDLWSPYYCGEGVPDFVINELTSTPWVPFPLPNLNITFPKDPNGYPLVDACLKVSRDLLSALPCVTVHRIPSSSTTLARRWGTPSRTCTTITLGCRSFWPATGSKWP